MTVLVRQNTAGTTALNGTAPDPTNIPGNNWYTNAPTYFYRNSTGGVLIPNSAYANGVLSYNLGTARQKVTLNSATVQGSGAYIRLQANMDAQGSYVFSSGTGYYILIIASTTLQLYSWSGSGTNTAIGSASASALPAAPFTVTTAYIEQLVSGTVNASVTISDTTYSVTATVGSPLTGTYAGLFTSTDAAGNIAASEIVMEDNAVVSTIYEIASLNRGVGRGIARGLA
jgi:hypothetical protein